MLLIGSVTFAATNVLVLTWEQPPGFKGTLYKANNLNGEWTVFGESPPPVNTETTNSMAFFKVEVTNTNLINDIVIYALNPNNESLRPFYTNKAAFAYSMDASLPLFFWNTNGNGLWQ